jgi:hypothetical protein
MVRPIFANSVEEEIWRGERATAVAEGTVYQDQAEILMLLIHVFTTTRMTSTERPPFRKLKVCSATT